MYNVDGNLITGRKPLWSNHATILTAETQTWVALVRTSALTAVHVAGNRVCPMAHLPSCYG